MNHGTHGIHGIARKKEMKDSSLFFFVSFRVIRGSLLFSSFRAIPCIPWWVMNYGRVRATRKPGLVSPRDPNAHANVTAS